MLTLPLKSDFLYESLPYVQVSTGLTAFGTIDNRIGQISALILLGTGVFLLWKKKNGLLPVPAIPRSCSPECATGGQCALKKSHPAPLVWRNSFNTGNTVIDARLRGLFSIANGLLEGIADDEPKSVLDPMIDALIERVGAYLMAKEESLASGERKPNEHQRSAHDKLIEAMEERRNLYRLGKISRNELAGFITHDIIAAHAITTCFESTFQHGAWSKQQCHRQFSPPCDKPNFQNDSRSHATG